LKRVHAFHHQLSFVQLPYGCQQHHISSPLWEKEGKSTDSQKFSSSKILELLVMRIWLMQLRQNDRSLGSEKWGYLYQSILVLTILSHPKVKIRGKFYPSYFILVKVREIFFPVKFVFPFFFFLVLGPIPVKFVNPACHISFARDTALFFQ
jgi:hypothetical protein